jgi:signal transduction histidine kinase/CheY-like chemotaxis protein
MDELYGLPRDGRARVYGDWRSRLHPEDLARAEREFDEAIRITGRYNSDYRLRLPDGTVRHIRAIGALYSDPDGTSKIVGVNWDVTADVLRNAELDAKRLEAEAASIAKSQFLATMSHEIRTPMNGILGMLDLLLRSNLTSDQAQRAEIACDSARHLLAILNDVLDFSKLEAHQVVLQLAPTDVARVARDVITLLSAGVEPRRLLLRLDIGPGLPAWLRCDAARLRQVLINLVGNAIKFTEAGSIDVILRFEPGGTAEAEGRLTVAVRDTGVGIAREAQRKLFQRFVQVDGSDSRSRGGTGLGLAISRQLIELMGGTIGVESAPGQGSTFRFTIRAAPCAAPESVAPERRRSQRIAPIATTVPARILLAEDNRTNQQILSAYLALAGHSVHLVENGRRAVEAATAERFDLVLMDIQMPELDGVAAARHIRAIDGPGGQVPIIALTANAMDGDREEYIAAGMTDYVTKPITPDALFAAIARAIAPDHHAPVRASSVSHSPE